LTACCSEELLEGVERLFRIGWRGSAYAFLRLRFKAEEGGDQIVNRW
jgi:hypothetical protein